MPQAWEICGQQVDHRRDFRQVKWHEQSDHDPLELDNYERGGCRRPSTMPSTSISKFDFDPNTRVLSVWFVASGKHYEFLDVPVEAFAAFQSAFAKGRHFNNHIRNNYAFRLAEGNAGSSSSD